MTPRKHISWKTKCAAALLDAMMVRERGGLYPQRWYDDAKKMTEAQFLSLFHWDHNILHETEHEHRDKFWNLTPMYVSAHREKTKLDAKVIAKGRRIRAKQSDAAGADNPVARLRYAPLRIEPDEAGGVTLLAPSIRPSSGSHKRKLHSRGFDKTLRKKLDGSVVKRER